MKRASDLGIRALVIKGDMNLFFKIPFLVVGSVVVHYDLQLS